VRKKRRYYTENELAYLAARYGETPTADIARRLGRTRAAVRHAARKLGLDAGRQWSAAEEAELRRLYGTADVREVARRGCRCGTRR
jgi:hypothetical protein